MKSVKQHLNSLLMKAKIYKVHHTGDAFDKLQESAYADLDIMSRLRGCYSYEIRDSDTFKNTFLVEKKIKDFREERIKRKLDLSPNKIEGDLKVLDIEDQANQNEMSNFKDGDVMFVSSGDVSPNGPLNISIAGEEGQSMRNI